MQLRIGKGAVGIIPADAGSTRHGRSHTDCSRDHPRGCGEHVTDRMTPDWISGSSPRMRGALVVHVHAPAPPGITPADAGSTRR